MNRKIMLGIAVVIAIPLLVGASFGFSLLSKAHMLPWQEDSTRIPVTPFADVPASDESDSAPASDEPEFDYDYDTGAAVSDSAGLSSDFGGDGDDGSDDSADVAQSSSTPSPAASPPATGSPAATPEGATTFAIVGEQSEATVTVRQQLTALPDPNDAVLATQAFRGQIVLGPDGQPAEGSTIQVDLRTLESDEPDRDNFIRGNTLESDQFPIAEFAITGVEDWPGPLQQGQEATFKLVGDLTIHGETRPVTFDTTATLGGETVTGTSTTSFTFQDFGMSAPEISGFVNAEDDIGLEVTITATRQ